MSDYLIYRLKVSLLTPLHIGSGRELLKDYDYAVYGGKTWRINEAALLDAQDAGDPAVAAQLAQTPPAHLLKPQDFVPKSGFFRYVIRGQPRSQAAGAKLREQIKDAFDRPYLPGSSLKGALRTVLAWSGWGERRLPLDRGWLGDNRKWAAKKYENELFGGDPNHDLLRALQVSDSAPLSPDRLLLVNAGVFNRGGGAAKSSIPVELEAVSPDTVFEMTLKLDRALYSSWARNGGLALQGGTWLEGLAARAQERCRQRLQEEAQWHQNARQLQELLSFYQKAQKALQAGGNSFLIQIGWGGGWDSKTFGSRLRASPGFMETIIKKYKMARGKRQGDAPFPASRRAAVVYGKNSDGRQAVVPYVPLGWALVEMEEKQP